VLGTIKKKKKKKKVKKRKEKKKDLADETGDLLFEFLHHIHQPVNFMSFVKVKITPSKWRACLWQ